MSGMKKLALAALALLAVPFAAKAEVVIGVGIPGPFFHPYHHGRYYRPYVVVAPPPIVVAPAPRVVYVTPAPEYLQPVAPPPATVYVPR